MAAPDERRGLLGRQKMSEGIILLAVAAVWVSGVVWAFVILTNRTSVAPKTEAIATPAPPISIDHKLSGDQLARLNETLTSGLDRRLQAFGTSASSHLTEERVLHDSRQRLGAIDLPDGNGFGIEIVARLSVVEDDFEDDDSGYNVIVNENWSLPGVNLNELRLRASSYSTLLTAISLVRAPNGRQYINALDGTKRKTFAVENSEWSQEDGRPIDQSAFLAIEAGSLPRFAIQPEPRPTTADEAFAKARGERRGRAFLLEYEDGNGAPSYRVISDVRRSADKFSARCHFRWGMRRTFRFDRVRSVHSANDGEEIPLTLFAQSNDVLRANDQRRQSKVASSRRRAK